MKKFLFILMAALMIMGTVTGCSKNTGSNKKDIYTIAIIQPMEHPSLNTIRENIVLGLEEAGLKDKVEIIYKNANGDPSLLPSIMQSLKSDGVDMLVPIGTGAAQSASATNTTTPIVFSAVSNPIEAGLVTALDKTTGNITGVSDAIATEEIINLALELTPNIKTFGFVYNSSEINSTAGIEQAKAYLDELGLSYKEATITSTADVQQSASSLVGNIDAFFTPIDNTVASAMDTFAQVANKSGLPIYVSADSMVTDGGLATVGIDYTVLGKQTASMIARIYNGEKISENPVESMTEYSKMINKNVADSLELNISEDLLKTFVIIGE
jgi:putative ABC transport system substrate-binding protein